MTLKTTRDQIVEALDVLSPAQQEEVLVAVRRVQAHTLPPTTSGAELARRAAEFRLPPEDVEDMLQAIEDGCEQVNPDDWA